MAARADFRGKVTQIFRVSLTDHTPALGEEPRLGFADPLRVGKTEVEWGEAGLERGTQACLPCGGPGLTLKDGILVGWGDRHRASLPLPTAPPHFMHCKTSTHHGPSYSLIAWEQVLQPRHNDIFSQTASTKGESSVAQPTSSQEMTMKCSLRDKLASTREIVQNLSQVTFAQWSLHFDGVF